MIFSLVVFFALVWTAEPAAAGDFGTNYQVEVVFTTGFWTVLQAADGQSNRRPVYEDSTGRFRLEHQVGAVEQPPPAADGAAAAPPDRWAEAAVEDGQWLLFESGRLRALVSSWAPTPWSVGALSPRARWVILDDHGGEQPAATTWACRLADGGRDPSVLVRSWRVRHVGGVYAQLGSWSDDRPVYVRHDGRFIYHLAQMGRWMISDDPPGSLSGVAFADSTAHRPDLVPEGAWQAHYVTDGGADANLVEASWQVEPGMVAIGVPGDASGAAHPHFLAALSAGWTDERRDQLQQVANQITILNNGLPMPMLGMGIGGLPNEGPVTGEVTAGALDQAQYMLVDSSGGYGNEPLLGAALNSEPTPGAPPRRARTFVLGKIWPTELGFGRTLAAARHSLARLRTSHFDLLLLHWPECHGDWDWMDCTDVLPGANWRQSWRALERLYAEGVALAIGVSNFTPDQLRYLAEQWAVVPPAVVQNFVDPLHVDVALLTACRQHAVTLQAYAPLRGIFERPAEHAALMERVQRQAADLARQPYALVPMDRSASAAAAPVTGVQLLLRWLLEQGIAVLTRSRSLDHLQENRRVFDFQLSLEQMEAAVARPALELFPHWNFGPVARDALLSVEGRPDAEQAEAWSRALVTRRAIVRAQLYSAPFDKHLRTVLDVAGTAAAVTEQPSPAELTDDERHDLELKQAAERAAALAAQAQSQARSQERPARGGGQEPPAAQTISPTADESAGRNSAQQKAYDVAKRQAEREEERRKQAEKERRQRALEQEMLAAERARRDRVAANEDHQRRRARELRRFDPQYDPEDNVRVDDEAGGPSAGPFFRDWELIAALLLFVVGVIAASTCYFSASSSSGDVHPSAMYAAKRGKIA